MAGLPKNLSEYTEQAYGPEAVQKLSDIFGTQAVIGRGLMTYAEETGNHRMEQDAAAIYGRAMRATLDGLKPEAREGFIHKAELAFGTDNNIRAGLETYFKGSDAVADGAHETGIQQELGGMQAIARSVLSTLRSDYQAHVTQRIPGALGSDDSNAARAEGPKTQMDRAVAEYAATMNANAGGNDRHFGDLQQAALVLAGVDVKQHLAELSRDPAHLVGAAGAIEKIFPEVTSGMEAIRQNQVDAHRAEAAGKALQTDMTAEDIAAIKQLAERMPSAMPRSEQQNEALGKAVEHAAHTDPEKYIREMGEAAQNLKSGAKPEELEALQNMQIAYSAVQGYKAQKNGAALAQLPESFAGRNMIGEFSQHVLSMGIEMENVVSTPSHSIHTVKEVVAGLGFHPAADDALQVAAPLTSPQPVTPFADPPFNRRRN